MRRRYHDTGWNRSVGECYLPLLTACMRYLKYPNLEYSLLTCPKTISNGTFSSLNVTHQMLTYAARSGTGKTTTSLSFTSYEHGQSTWHQNPQWLMDCEFCGNLSSPPAKEKQTKVAAVSQNPAPVARCRVLLFNFCRLCCSFNIIHSVDSRQKGAWLCEHHKGFRDVQAGLLFCRTKWQVAPCREAPR